MEDFYECEHEVRGNLYVTFSRNACCMWRFFFDGFGNPKTGWAAEFV